jgi:acyl carrier protein
MLQLVCEAVAETFGAPLARLGPETCALDVDGWDSLGHTVLMVRLERSCGFAISEQVATEANTIGDLALALARLSEERSALR